MRRLLLPLMLMLTLSTGAQALSIHHFHAYDAGSHITWKWTVCTSTRVRVQTIIGFAREGSRGWRHFYDSGYYRRGCSPWVSTTRDVYLNGFWDTYLQIGANPVRAITPIYTFTIG